MKTATLLQRLGPRTVLLTLIIGGVLFGRGSSSEYRAAESAPAPAWIVTLPTSFANDTSGRLLLFIKPAGDAQTQDLRVDSIFPGDTAVASQEIASFGTDHRITMDTSSNVFVPRTAMSAGKVGLAPGRYRAQVLLERDDRYNHDQGGPGDLLSPVIAITLPLKESITFPLSHEIPKLDLWDFPGSSAADIARRAAVRPHLEEFELRSNLLSSFWGREIRMRAWVLLPDDYRQDASKTWPTVYMLGVFGETHKNNIDVASYVHQLGVSNDPPMIWVFLDYSTPDGPTLFADSVNNGPWGSALTEEFIPALEKRYRMDARASGRFLTGHSSGGWASVWLQVRYPKFFGGAWATAPDPLDFRAFLNTNLYEKGANLYRDEDGNLLAVARNRDRVVTTTQDAAKLEQVLGPNGGVFRSWEWVYSPRGIDGAPLEMFSRRDGAVDPAVVHYWGDHYDIARLISRDWQKLRGDLDGKLHLFVGTLDDHYLDSSVHRLQDILDGLGAHAEIVFLEGKTHNNLYAKGDEPLGLLRDFAHAMYHTARKDGRDIP